MATKLRYSEEPQQLLLIMDIPVTLIFVSSLFGLAVFDFVRACSDPITKNRAAKVLVIGVGLLGFGFCIVDMGRGELVMHPIIKEKVIRHASDYKDYGAFRAAIESHARGLGLTSLRGQSGFLEGGGHGGGYFDGIYFHPQSWLVFCLACIAYVILYILRLSAKGRGLRSDTQRDP